MLAVSGGSSERSPESMLVSIARLHQRQHFVTPGKARATSERPAFQCRGGGGELHAGGHRFSLEQGDSICAVINVSAPGGVDSRHLEGRHLKQFAVAQAECSVL